jgi:hypothetical protein
MRLGSVNYETRGKVAILTLDAREGVAAFRGKREPKFSEK